MTNNKIVPARKAQSWGDIAVDGLWPGLIGGLLMMAYLVFVSLLDGVGPMTVFAYYLPDNNLPAVAGLVTHLAVSAVYGTILGLITAVISRWIGDERIMWQVGIVYGFLLWLGALLIIIPSGLSGLGAVPAGHLLISHLLYGLLSARMIINGRSAG